MSLVGIAALLAVQRPNFQQVSERGVGSAGRNAEVVPRVTMLATLDGAEDAKLSELWRLAAEPLGARRAVLLSQLAQRASEADMQAMLAWVARLEGSDLRHDFHRVLLGEWARSDGEAAMRYFRTLPQPDRSAALLSAVAGAWAQKQPHAAVSWLTAEALWAESGELEAVIGRAVASWPLATIVELAQYVQVGDPRHSLVRAAVQELTARDPASAADLAMTEVDLLGEVLPQWARVAPRAAVDWTRNLASGPERLAALVHVSHAWLQLDLPGAAAYAQTLPSGHEGFVAIVGGEWARRDPEAAAEWVLQLQDETARTRAIASVASAWTRDDPVGAAAFAAELLGGVRDTAIASIVSEWGRQDAPAAAQWVEMFPRGAVRQAAIQKIADAWIHTDPTNAVAWVQRLPSGADRDAALHAASGSLMVLHPDLAAIVAQSIGETSLRGRQIERAARAWLAVDPPAATRWITGAGLPPVLTRRLLSSRTPAADAGGALQSRIEPRS